MKYFVLSLILILASISASQADTTQDSKKPADIDFEKIDAVEAEKIDAVEALAIANAWKWSRKDIKSSVTAREVVFQFADGKQKKIPLPQEKMLVAVAPYLRKTHK